MPGGLNLIARSGQWAELERRLNRIEPRLSRNILRTALRAGGNIVRDEARSRVPVKSGLLRRRIRTVARRGQPGQVRVSVGVFTSGGPKQQRTEPYYAPWVERGHKIVGRHRAGGPRLTARRQASKGRTRAFPFLEPALQAKAAEVERAIVEHVTRRLGEEVGY